MRATSYNDVQTTFASTDQLASDFETALKHYHYYFPNKIVPHIATFISGFNYPIAVTDSVLGVGLDMYLGKNYKFYKLMANTQLPSRFYEQTLHRSGCFTFVVAN